MVTGNVHDAPASMLVQAVGGTSAQPAISRHVGQSIDVRCWGTGAPLTPHTAHATIASERVNNFICVCVRLRRATYEAEQKR